MDPALIFLTSMVVSFNIGCAERRGAFTLCLLMVPMMRIHTLTCNALLTSLSRGVTANKEATNVGSSQLLLLLLLMEGECS